mmetsp:Transcript_56214/g.108474  ORF Transcript_56214/g.108474 Transcript_56214/m.108474 type:complete len:125 (+) Transcript_56214:432-806(+)
MSHFVKLFAKTADRRERLSSAPWEKLETVLLLLRMAAAAVVSRLRQSPLLLPPLHGRVADLPLTLRVWIAAPTQPPLPISVFLEVALAVGPLQPSWGDRVPAVCPVSLEPTSKRSFLCQHNTQC